MIVRTDAEEDTATQADARADAMTGGRFFGPLRWHRV